MRPDRTGTSIDAVAALGDPVRRRLHDAVRTAPGPMTREEAASAAGVSRKLAAFHLDKLVAVGLLRVGQRVEAAKRVGRTPKAYEPVEEAVSVSVPPRSYADLAAILVEAVGSQHAPVADSCREIALARGKSRGAAVIHETGTSAEPVLDRVQRCLSAHGYEPYRSGPQAVRMRNCPFHPLAQQATELVCGINLSYVSGLLKGMVAADVEATLAPREAECCVEVRAR